MIRRWLAPSRRREPNRDRLDEFYECTTCRACYDEWAEDCPRCGQLVVRIVEPPGGVTDRDARIAVGAMPTNRVSPDVDPR